MIPLNTVGKVISGDNKIRFVKVVFDIEDTGGYYIFMYEDESQIKGFDSWVLNSQELEDYFRLSGWEVEWLTSKSTSKL